MNLHLMFSDLRRDIVGAIVYVRINDTSEYDAPAKSIATAESAPLNISTIEPSIKLAIEIEKPAVYEELSVSVSVVGTTINNESIKFINTRLDSLPEADDEFLSITLERV